MFVLLLVDTFQHMEKITKWRERERREGLIMIFTFTDYEVAIARLQHKLLIN